MTTHVDFNTAKLLKEKGFDIPCREGWVNYLASFTGETRMPDNESNLVMDRLGNSHLIERPTIAEVVMWLYEKHGIWIWVIPTTNEHGDLMFTFHFTRINLPKFKQYNGGKYSTPTEAYQEAIKYCLTKLI